MKIIDESGRWKKYLETEEKLLNNTIDRKDDEKCQKK